MRKIILYFGIIYIVFVIITMITQTNILQYYKPIEAGTLDLSSTSYKKIQSVPLQGAWEFYPNKIVSYGDLQSIQDPKELQGGFIDVPSEWHTFVPSKESSVPKMTRTGIGTYRMHIKLPQPGYYALGLNSIYTSFTLFVNDQKLMSVGEIGTDKKSNHPQFLPMTTSFYTEKRAIDIIIQIGNFYHRKGGLVQEITFGTPEAIKRAFIVKNITSTYLSGALFIMGIFLLTFFSQSNKDKSLLFFSLFCIIIATRTLMNDTVTLLQIFPTFPFEAEMKIEYLTVSLGLLTFALYSRYAFSKIISSVITKIVVAVSSIYSIFILLTPVYIYNFVLVSFDLLIAVYSLYWLISMIAGFIQKKGGKLTIILGGIVLAITVINEIILYTQANFSSFYAYNLLPFGLFIFIFTHSFEFSFRYIEALRTSHELTENLEKKVVERTKELHQANKRLLHQATIDELTGIWNRNELQNRTEEETSRYNRYAKNLSTSFSVFYMDIDNLKYYNDTYSHEAGDQILTQFAHILTASCRKNDEVFRLGGDEFVMLLPKTDTDGAVRIAERILASKGSLNDSIQQYLRQSDHTFTDIPKDHTISCSIGIATHNEGTINIDSLIRYADRALLTAKSRGKDQFIVQDMENQSS